MSRPAYLADHDLNEHIVSGVRRREPLIGFLRVRDVGMSRQPDEAILEFANEHRLVVVKSGKSFPGLFMVRQSSPVGPIIENLVLIWSATELEEWENQVIFLPLE